MRYQEILEACWTGYRQAGMKKKGDRRVPNCVPVSEVKTGPEMTLNDLLYTAAAKAMHQAGLEGVPMDYEEAIKKAAKIYKIPYTPSELPKLLAQRNEIDRKLAMMKQGKQVAKARRKEKLAPTPAGAEEYWKTHALPTDRIKPPAKTLEETEAELAEDLKKWFKEKWVRFGPDGKIRGACARGSEKEGKPKCLPQSKAHALGKKGRASAAAKKRREDPNPERRGPARNVATKVSEDNKNLKDYVQDYLAKNNLKIHELANIDVKRISQEYQLPASQIKSVLIKYSANIKEQHDWDDADEFGMPGSEFFPNEKTGYRVIFKGRIIGVFDTMPKATEIAKQLEQKYGGQARVEHTVDEAQLDEKQDACYRKVKSRYKVWPSAYASGALVQCRKKGAANWGNKSKK